MIGVSPSIPVYLYTGVTDMRKSFTGLCGIVINEMDKDPETDSLFVFINRLRNRMKILYWDRHGFWLFYKLLESGTFQMPYIEDSGCEITIDHNQLLMMIEGVDISDIKLKKRFTR